MRKIGIDQTTAWILSVFFTSLTFGGLYGVTKLAAKSGPGAGKGHHAEEGHREEPAAPHGHPEASHHEATTEASPHHAAESPPAHGAEPAHGAPAADAAHGSPAAQPHKQPADDKKHAPAPAHHK